MLYGLASNEFSLDLLGDLEKICLCYSVAHLQEIDNYSKPNLYLDELTKNQSIYIIPEVVFPISSYSDLLSSKPLSIKRSPEENLHALIYNKSLVPIQSDFFSEIYAFLMGGKNHSAIEQISEQCQSELEALEAFILEQVIHLPDEYRAAAIERLNALKEEKEQAVASMKFLSEEILKIDDLDREIDGQSSIIGITEWVPLSELLNKLPSEHQAIGVEKYFGFGSEKYLISQLSDCATVLDLLGYFAEAKRKNAQKFMNIQMDVWHLFMGMFTSCFFTFDRKLAHRAATIYDYLNVDTKVFWMNKKISENLIRLY